MAKLSIIDNGFENLNEIIKQAFETAPESDLEKAKAEARSEKAGINILNEGYGLTRFGKTPLSSREINEIYKLVFYC